MGVAGEETPLRSKESKLTPKEVSQDGPDSWTCCQIVAAVEVPELERHREQLLLGCLFTTAVGVLLSAVGFFAGYSSSRFMVRKFPWIVGEVQGGDREFHGGIKYVCVEGGCHSWSRDPVCDMATASYVCEACRDASLAIGCSVLIALVTYVSFAQKTYERWRGQDRPLTKFIASVLAVFGALNFLGVLWTYDDTCIKVAERFPRVDVRAGAGYHCLILASVLKVIMGGIHLALPVRPLAATAAPELEGRA